MAKTRSESPSLSLTIQIMNAIGAKSKCKLVRGARDGIPFLKNRIYRLLEPDNAKNRFWSPKNTVLRFENTKTAHLGPKSRYSKIRISQNPLFAPSLTGTSSSFSYLCDVELERRLAVVVIRDQRRRNLRVDIHLDEELKFRWDRINGCIVIYGEHSNKNCT